MNHCAGTWPKPWPGVDARWVPFPCCRRAPRSRQRRWLRRPLRRHPSPQRRRLAPPALSGSLKDIARHAAREAERELIFRTLQHTRWNRREAAEILGISYKALLYKIKEAELDKAS